jgi:hypothetical protein
MVSKLSQILEHDVVGRQFSIVNGSISGLNLTLTGGFCVRLSVVAQFTDTPVTVINNSTTFVYINTNTLTIAASTIQPAEDFVMIYEIVAATGAITTIIDWRSRSDGIVDAS